LLAGGASFDIFRDPSLGTRPEVFPVDTSDGFISSGVTVDGSFVPYVHEFTFQALIWGYDESSAFNISPEGFVQVVHAFDWVDAGPFVHQSSVVVLNAGDCVFN
jgi:hypothetical protein